MKMLGRIKGVSSGLRLAALGGCVATLGACAGMELDNARGTQPAGSAFNNQLYAGYVGLSEDEFAEYDYDDSDGFAMKASAAAGDGSVMPANLEEWDIPEDHVAELSSARARLINALDAGGRSIAPDIAAHTQVVFDCWVQEQEEDIQPDHIAACRSAFYSSISALEVAIRPDEPQVAAPEPEPEPAPEPAAVATYYVVFFDFNSAELSTASKTTVSEAAAAAKQMRPYKILVYGHTDRAGSNDYNKALAERRARAVAHFLSEQGAGRFGVDLESFGEDKPVAKTSDNVRDGRNRRVEITLTESE
jgi:outer membrane protein OmpA-like peptidoglycan-associated protein